LSDNELESRNKIRFAVSGFGHIGRRHVEEISRHPEAELAAIADTNAAALGIAQQQYTKVPLFESLKQMLTQSPDIDIVCICTPNGLHIPQGRTILETGKHVLIEKPFGLKKKDCDDLLDLAQAKNKEVFCVLQNRYSPPALLIKSLLEEEKLGKIYWVQVNCFWNRDERYYTPGSWRGTKDLDGGPLFTQFSHFVDLLYWTLGPLKNISGRFSNYNHPALKDLEDTGFFHFRLERGGEGTFSYSTSVSEKNLESSITIIAENGTLKAGGQYMDKIEHFEVKGMTRPELPPSNPPNHYGHFQGSAANHSFVIENVIKALRGQPYEMASAEEAAASVAIIEEVYRLRDKQGIFRQGS
jgi:predicted dehydrogenase